MLKQTNRTIQVGLTDASQHLLFAALKKQPFASFRRKRNQFQFTLNSSIREFMNYQSQIDALSALAHGDRLAVFRLLARRAPDGVRPSEIADALGLKPNTLSGHVKTLADAGLAKTWREGKSVFYGIDLQAVGGLIEFLAGDCCRGRPEVCAPTSARMFHPSTKKGTGGEERTYHTLFTCTGNSARSIFAEAILAREGQDRFVAHSAGTYPASALNPFAIQVLEEFGHDVSDLRAKTIAEFHGLNAPKLDFVITVCDQAANEECPPWSSQPIAAHWGMPDPVKTQGSYAEKHLAFWQTYKAMERRIQAFVALPLESLDRISLQQRTDEIGRSADTEERLSEPKDIRERRSS